MNLRSRANQSFASPELLLRRKHKTDILRHTKSMTLGRLGRQKKENPSAIFRSPSIYEDHGKIDLRAEPVKKEEDTMTSYLSGKICPLTPSIKPCNVDHLAKKTPSPVQVKPVEPQQQPRVEEEQAAMEDVEGDDTDTIKVHPIAIHDGILNQKKSICTIS